MVCTSLTMEMRFSGGSRCRTKYLYGEMEPVNVRLQHKQAVVDESESCVIGAKVHKWARQLLAWDWGFEVGLGDSRRS